MGERSEIGEREGPWDQVLVAIDGSDQSMAALRSAVSLASNVNARLTVVHVVQPGPMVSSFDPPHKWLEAYELARTTGEQLLTDARIRFDVGVPWVTEVLTGDPADAICRRAEELNADVIVVGSRGMGAIDRLLLGSVSSTISQQAPCSVLVVRERSQNPP